MTHKPLLWVEVGAHAVRKRSECDGVVWGQARVSRGVCVCVVFWSLFGRSSVVSFLWVCFAWFGFLSEPFLKVALAALATAASTQASGLSRVMSRSCEQNRAAMVIVALSS